jgi:hypothetical protein
LVFSVRYITLVRLSTQAEILGLFEVTAYAPPPAIAMPAIKATTVRRLRVKKVLCLAMDVIITSLPQSPLRKSFVAV